MNKSNSKFINILTKQNTNNILIQIPINDVSVAGNYCNDNLYPYFNSKNKMFFECGIDELKNLLSVCNNSTKDIDEHKLIDSDIIIDIPSIKQVGGTNPMTDDEFRKAIRFMDGGGFVLPNETTVYPDGRVI